MSKNRLSLLLAVMAMVVVAVGGFFLAVQPQIAQTAAAHAQTETVNATNGASRTELARLRDQAAELPAMRRELAARSASVPDSADVSPFLDELTAIATSAGMQVSSFTASDATAYSPTVTADPANTDSASGGSGSTANASPSAEPSATATATAPSAPAAPSIVTDPSITAQNLSVIPVTVAVDGSFEQALSFVKGVQSGQRLFLITSISSAEKSGDDGAASATSTWTFGGSIYVLDRSADTTSTTASKG